MATDEDTPLDPVLSRTQEIPLESIPLPSENESIEIGQTLDVDSVPGSRMERGLTSVKISSGPSKAGSETMPRATVARETMRMVKGEGLDDAVVIMQGVVLMIIFNACFITAKLVPPILNIEEFDDVIFLVFNSFFVAASLIFFYLNPLMPLVTAGLSIAQGLCFLFLVEIISMSIRGHAKTFYLILTAMLGSTFGVLNISTFAMVAFAHVNRLDMFTFGSALGGCAPYLFNVLLKYTFIPGSDKADCYNRMLCLTGFVCVVCIVNGVMLILYLNTPKVYTHYTISGAHGIADAKCSALGILQGLQYTWPFYATGAMIMLNVYLYYPGIIPGSWDLTMNGKLNFMGIFNLVVLAGRSYAIFVPPRFQIRDRLWVFGMACVPIAATAYILVYFFYKRVMHLSFAASVVLSVFSVLVHGYCIGFSMKSIQASLPLQLYRDIRASTLLGFGMVIDYSFVIANGFSYLLIYLQAR